MAEFNPGLDQGQVLTADELQRIFECSGQGGMRRAHRTNSLVLISKTSGATYFDRWEGDVFHYTGMGLMGDQRLDGAQNKTLAESNSNGVAVFLFENPASNQYVFRGRVVLADAPYSESQPDREGRERTVWVFPLRLHEKPSPVETRTRYWLNTHSRESWRVCLDRDIRLMTRTRAKPAIKPGDLVVSFVAGEGGRWASVEEVVSEMREDNAPIYQGYDSHFEWDIRPVTGRLPFERAVEVRETVRRLRLFEGAYGNWGVRVRNSGIELVESDVELIIGWIEERDSEGGK